MSALFLLVGLLIGALAVALLMRTRLRALTAEAAKSSELDREVVRLTAELKHERDLNGDRQRMSDSFKALSAEALQASMTQLTEMARAQLKTAQTEVKGDLDKRQAAVEQ